jgi:F-type H+-transporting ATPase subunit b
MFEQIFNFLTFLAVSEAETEAVSSGGIGAIGVDTKALLFQIANFAILFWVLKKVAYKPILKVLEDRRLTIEESLKTAKKLEADQEKAEAKQAEVLANARTEADKILALAHAEASKNAKTAEDKAAQRTKKMIDEAHSKIESDIKNVKRELRSEVLNLVARATEAVIEEKIDTQKDKELLNKAIERQKELV